MIISHGTAHKTPKNFRKALASERKALATWESITPLARNEWICWMVSPKREETKQEHLKRALADLKNGKRRPCCWYGCIHRKDKAVSPSVRSLL